MSCSSQQLGEHICSEQGNRSKDFQLLSYYNRIISLELASILGITIAMHPSALVFLCNSYISEGTAHCTGKGSS